MSNNNIAIVILAAGKGTRLKSSLAKVLHRAGGRTLVEQIVAILCAAEGTPDGGRRGPPGGTRRGGGSSRSRRLPCCSSHKMARPRDANREARARPRKVCCCAPGRCSPRAHRYLEGADCRASQWKCGGNSSLCGARRSFRLRPGLCANRNGRLRDLWKNRSSPTSSATSTKSIRRFIALPWRNSGPRWHM